MMGKVKPSLPFACLTAYVGRLLTEEIHARGNSKEMTQRKMNDTDFYCLFYPLNNTHFLRYLDVSYNFITDAGASWIASLLKVMNGIV
jgi:hypothetical protein